MLKDSGAEQKNQDGRMIDISQLLGIIAEFGVNNLLIEGGAKLITSCLNLYVIDEIYWFYSNKIIGSYGKRAIDNLDVERYIDDFMIKETIWLNGNFLAVLRKD